MSIIATGGYQMQSEISRVRSLHSPLRALDISDYIWCKGDDDELIWVAENETAAVLKVGIYQK